MALSRQLVDLPFSKGLNTKPDPNQIPLGDLLILQNAIFTSPGKLQKKNGSAPLTQSILGGGTIGNPTALLSRANELLQVGNGSLYSYDSANAGWANKGTLPSVVTTSASVAQAQFSVLALDMAQAANGLQCFVFELFDTNAASSQKKGVWYSLYDPSTGQVVVPPTLIDATASTVCPRVVAFGNTLACYYVQGDLSTTAGIFGRTFDATAPTGAWSAQTQLTSGTTTSAQRVADGYAFDVIASGTSLYLAFCNRSNTATIFQMAQAAPLVPTANVVVGTTSAPFQTCVAADLNGNIAFAVNDGGVIFTPKAAVYTSALVSVTGLTALDGVLSGGRAIVGVCTASGVLRFFFGGDSSASLPDQDFIRTATFTLTSGSYVAAGAASVSRAVAIAGKPFAIGGAAYVPAWYSPAFAAAQDQNTIYVVDANGAPVAKALTGIAAGLNGIGAALTAIGRYQPASTIVAGSAATFPAGGSTVLKAAAVSPGFTPVFGPSVATTTTLTYQFGGYALTFDFGNTANSYQRAEQSNELHVNGGILRMYDGQTVVEHGFLMFPSFLTLSTAGGGNLSAGQYGYAAVYSWVDGQGQLHRGAASALVNITVAASGQVGIVVPTLRLTQKSGVMIDIYRTTANGTTLYQLTNIGKQGSLYSDKTADTVNFTDTVSDAALIAHPTLYTLGGVVDNDPCPPAGAMCIHRNRLFVVDSTTGQIAYSKEIVPPGPVEFSDFFRLNVDPKGGTTTALASLDDKLIVFKKDRVFMVLGQGPDATGQQSDFTDSILVSAGTGCINPKSIALVPSGLMYQSPKGIGLLGRDLSVSYTGAGVESFVTGAKPLLNVVSALVKPYQSQVVFTTDGLSILLYDYAERQWSQLPVNQTGALLDAVINTTLATTGAAHYVLLSDGAGGGSVLAETPGVFADGANTIAQKVQTGWIKLSGLQGFQRARRLYVLGNYKSPHTLQVTVEYDYGTANSHTASMAFSSDPAPYQLLVHLAQQKCEAIRVTLQEVPNGTGEGLSLSGLTLEIGVKQGGYKVPASKQTG